MKKLVKVSGKMGCRKWAREAHNMMWSLPKVWLREKVAMARVPDGNMQF